MVPVACPREYANTESEAVTTVKNPLTHGDTPQVFVFGGGVFRT